MEKIETGDDPRLTVIRDFLESDDSLGAKIAVWSVVFPIGDWSFIRDARDEDIDEMVAVIGRLAKAKEDLGVLGVSVKE